MSNHLKAIPYTDGKAREIVKRFCDHVHWLVTVRHTFKVLYEDEQPSCQELMEKTAPWFFADLNRILLEYLLLESAKITDPAITHGHENHTVEFLVQYICWPTDKAILSKLTSLPDGDKDIPRELKSLRTATNDFRGYIECARNKRLAHSDMESVLSGNTLGEFPEGEDLAFFDALQKLCNITHEICFGTIYGDMIPTGPGDVIDLRQTLEFAAAFKEALSESSGQNETWLYSCLQRARHETTRQ